MSIALGVQSIDSQNADALALNVAALTGILGVQLSNGSSYTALPSLPSAPSASVTAINAASTPVAASELDPLTPKGGTASGAAALTHVITTITTTLNGIQSNTVAGFTQLVTSSGFQLLLQVLGSTGRPTGGSATSSGPAGQTSAAQLAALLTATDSGATGTRSESSGATDVSNAAVPPIPGRAVIEQSSNSVNPAPYFQQLLGELESTYKTAPVYGATASTTVSLEAGSVVSPTTNAASDSASSQNSELDLFLKWLSVNGASSVVASA